jgi:hypothetical protein
MDYNELTKLADEILDMDAEEFGVFNDYLVRNGKEPLDLPRELRIGFSDVEEQVPEK